MNDYSSVLQTRKNRWLDFYDLTSPQRMMFLIRYAPDLPARPVPNPELKQERIEWIWQNYAYHLERMAWLDDDNMPCLDMLTGTEIFAEAFGCKIHRTADANPFTLPLVHSPAEADALQIPAIDAPPLALLFEMADELARRAGPEALFRLVDLQSPMDIAALIWEKSSFYISLVDAPGSVLALAEKVKTLQFNFLDEWFRRYGQEFVAHFPDYYLPRGITLSVDEIGVVSSAMFKKFFLPELEQFSQRYQGLGMHCCANARHQWDNFTKIPGLRLLNINHTPQVVEEAYRHFAGFVPQWHSDQPALLEAPGWIDKMPAGAHVVLETWAESREQAVRCAGLLRTKSAGLA